MQHIKYIIVAGIVACIALVGGSNIARADATVQDVIDKNLAARGGKEKLAAIKSMRQTGTIVFPGGQGQATLVTESVRPDKARMDFTVGGETFSRVYNNGNAWGNAPGSKDLAPLPEEFYRDIQETSDIDGPLVDWKAKGHTIELMGKEKPKPNMPEAYKLKLTLKNGHVIIDFVDTETGLETVQRIMEGNEVSDEVVYSDWKEVEGVKFAHKLSIKSGDEPPLTYDVQKIEVNPKIDDARFKKPEGIKGDTSKPAKE